MLERAEKIIFFLLVFFISSQVGFHFWPDFAYVYGIRIDYLSPTLYLLDILIVALFVLFTIRTKFKGFDYPTLRHPTIQILLMLFALSLVWNSFNSLSPAAHLFGIVKMAEFIFLGFYVAHNLKRKWIRSFIVVLALSAIFSSIIAIRQFISQSSIGGILYYLGERTFTGSTIGISTVNLNEQLLRPYAAFPHPNLLAFFLFMAIVFMMFRIPFEKKISEKLFFGVSAFISSIALMLTFSRITILLFIAFLFYVIYSKLKSNTLKLSFALSVFVLFLLLFFSFSWSGQFLFRGINLRLELLEQSFAIAQASPYFGIGLNNFFVHQAPLIKTVSPIVFQPPHNIYVLALISLGLLGSPFFIYVLITAFRKCFEKLKIKDPEVKAFYKSIFIIFIGILIAGIVDHFFLTLEQGQIILALILGFSFLKFDPSGFEKRNGKRRK